MSAAAVVCKSQTLPEKKAVGDFAHLISPENLFSPAAPATQRSRQSFAWSHMISVCAVLYFVVPLLFLTGLKLNMLFVLLCTN